MNKLLPTIADMPEEDRSLVDSALTDLVQIVKGIFGEQLKNRNDIGIRAGLITLMEHNFIKVKEEGDYIQWMMYQPSSDSWIALPTSRAYQERRKKMREIKYQAWHEATKSMFQVSEISWTKSGIIDSIGVAGTSYRFDASGIKLREFIGRKDSNGVEIYEGDVVNSTHLANPLIVKWDIDCAGFRLTHPSDEDYVWRAWIDVEIIGNIYENPELLKDKTQ